MMVALAAGAPSASFGRWTSIDWSVVYKHVHRLQMRIAKAVEQERWHKVAALSRILTRSYYAKLWAVRRVVTNKGKNTAGVDRIIWKTPKQKVNARHIKVRGYAHPYDPFHAEYFEQRRNRQWLRRKKDSRFLAIPAIERMV
jgi:RNA-directed DNA polymerase